MDKKAYLTIDDAPSVHLKQKIDYLVSKSIPAVLFCSGNLLEQRAEEAVYAIRHGFILGNHAYDHPHFSALTLPECYSQILRTDKIIDAIYKSAGVERPARYFRFPFGDKGELPCAVASNIQHIKRRKPQIQAYLRELGYCQPDFKAITYAYYRNSCLAADADCYWTYDVYEWSVFAPAPQYGIDKLEKVLARMEEDVPEECRGLNYNGSADIIVIHDHDASSAMFVPIIERLLAKGIGFLKFE